MKHLLKLIILFFVSSVYAQNIPEKPSNVYDDFIYNRQSVKQREVVQWPYLREADVFWAKRVIRMIDVREKQNQPMAWPKNPLSILLFNAVMSGQLVPYKNDSLGSAYTLEDIFREKLADTTVQDETDSLTGEPTGRQIKIANPFQPDLRIYKYRIVEDWIFDKKESRMFVRIIAIAPQFRPKFNGAETDQFDDLCVLRYHKKDGTNEKDIRDILINQEVFNRQNDAARLTYDDWFEQRLFSSYIVKEANMYDRYIREIAEFKDDGMAALLESDRIKNELFEREHDLWEY